MSSSLNISITSNESSTDNASNLLVSTSSPREQMKNLKRLFMALACGSKQGSVKISYSADAPVQASGTFTLVSAIATDAVTVGKTTFTFTSTPTLSTDVEVDGASDTLDAAALAAAINANTTTNKIVVASSALGVVTITALVPGTIGNYIAISSADATITASATYLAGGAGGAESSPVSYQVS